MEKGTNKIGKKFGMLLVLEKRYKPEAKYKYYWLCKCDCGKIKEIRNDQLGRSTVSCGCYNKSLNQTKIADATRTHGMTDTKLYSMWRDLRNRCYNKNVDRYQNYGGRGITVCNEWKEAFEPFMEWAFSNGYKEGLTIDRIDVNGNYEPSNCRFISKKAQMRNKTSNVMINYYGNTICIKELSEITGLNDKMLYARYYRGDRGERLWREPKNK
ncbi:hypothetical protein [Schinkia azotoformans]|uniref:hypothetical protein n=1 Tax=Schinkia azotoformans TaxID=1454 RepID=UPI002DBF99C0|nr:hypothetical protein [Schinkia azotoformans]MEC1716608.1 hypothetical protein [Schinkia azotoformans]MEC1739446.1 hypothetical protein [Schinkia azotoformans]MEC1745484.1 hypothetical protein [Schinkia azotoformans]MEC1756547.1 hypothetical protein [Schinkia azotoformans]MEC1765814.1 hypothetical protein [Schinkia azotoformans]